MPAPRPPAGLTASGRGGGGSGGDSGAAPPPLMRCSPASSALISSALRSPTEVTEGIELTLMSRRRADCMNEPCVASGDWPCGSGGGGGDAAAPKAAAPAADACGGGTRLQPSLPPPALPTATAAADTIAPG